MISTVKALQEKHPHTLLFLWRHRQRRSYQSCVISSQLTGLLSHMKVRAHVPHAAEGFFRASEVQAVSKPEAASGRSENHPVV